MAERTTGTIHRSQAVSTYGVGSVYELRQFYKHGSSLHSVMMAGLDHWSTEKLVRVREPDLEASLGVDHFFAPPVQEEEGVKSHPIGVPAVRFPRWLVCEGCKRLGKVPDQFEDHGSFGPKCRAVDCGSRGIPSRLIIACHPGKDGSPDDQPGHVDDFPWIFWLFSEGQTRCPSPQLRLTSNGKTASLAGLEVSCHCQIHKGGLRRSLEGVFYANALAGCKCHGNRPWLDDQQSGCDRPVRALLRGASNVYFPVSVSAISIPPFSQDLHQFLLNDAEQHLRSGLDKQLIIKVLRNVFPKMKKKLAGSNDYVYSDRQISEAIDLIQNSGKSRSPKTQQELRTLERQAILEGRDGEADSQFEAEVVRDLPKDLVGLVSGLVRVRRLREVRALRGFCRVSPPASGDPVHTPCAPLSRQPTNWLPAIEVRGEGIYLELNPDEVNRWENRDEIKERINVLRANYSTVRVRNGGTISSEDELPTARQVLIHTLTHLLIKQLSLDCGYSSAALRERLYIKPSSTDDIGEVGCLIYTSTAGADGTNGGLVRQGRATNFRSTLLGAIRDAMWCSSDPLCVEFRGQGADALNLAACHSCCLISETSCELRNLFLDRVLLIGSPDDPSIGYFHKLIRPEEGLAHE